MPSQEQPSEDDWTFVKPKSRRGRASKYSRVTPDILRKNGHDPAPLTGGGRTCEEISSEYRRLRSGWEDTEAAQQVVELTKDKSPTAVSRAVCLGIGTFDPPDGGWEMKRRTFIQLISFLLMVEALEKRDKSQIECLFQDPVFTETDKAFLSSLGHQVVDSPEGFDKIDSNTLLSGVHLYRPIYAKALENALPAVFVGTDLDVWDSVTLGNIDDLAKGKTMEETYEKKKHPQDSMSTAFTNTTIYWRPTTIPGDSKADETNGKTSKADSDNEDDLSKKLESTTINEKKAPEGAETSNT